MGAVAAVAKADRWTNREGNRRIIILSNDDLHEALLAMQQDEIAVTAPYTSLLGAWVCERQGFEHSVFSNISISYPSMPSQSCQISGRFSILRSCLRPAERLIESFKQGPK